MSTRDPVCITSAHLVQRYNHGVALAEGGGWHLRRPSQQPDLVQPSPIGGLVDAAAAPAASSHPPNSIFRHSRWLPTSLRQLGWCGMSALRRCLSLDASACPGQASSARNDAHFSHKIDKAPFLPMSQL